MKPSETGWEKYFGSPTLKAARWERSAATVAELFDLALKQSDPLTRCPPTSFHPVVIFRLVLQTINGAPGCAFSAEILQRQA